MAVTLVSQPTTPNVAYTKLVYVVSGSGTTSNPQYSYLMDIYDSGSLNRLARITQVPNPEGVAEFNPASIFQANLSADNFFTASYGLSAVNSYKTFQVKFGEVYGTSASSSITYYPDLVTDTIDVFRGTVDPNSGKYNFPSASYVPSPSVNSNLTLRPDPGNKSMPIGLSDYDVLTALRFSEENLPSFPQFIGVDEYGTIITLNGSELYTKFKNTILDVPSGPKNYEGIPDFDDYFASRWAFYIFYHSLTPSNTVFLIAANHNEAATRQEFEILNNGVEYESRCGEKLRFAFINKNGVYDFYNCYGPLRRSSTVDKNIVSLPKVDYSGTVSTYSYENGGEKDYHRDTNDSYSITTQLLNEDMATYLQNLLESPEVLVQQSSSMVPVVITNSSYEVLTNENRQKVFNYTIEFTPSNGREIFSTEVVQREPTPRRTFTWEVTSSFAIESPELDVSSSFYPSTIGGQIIPGWDQTIPYSGSSTVDRWVSASSDIIMVGEYSPYDFPTYSGSIYVVQSMYVDGVLYDTATAYTSSNDSVILFVSNSAFNTTDLSWDNIKVVSNVYQEQLPPTPTPTPTQTPTATPTPTPTLTPTPTPSELPCDLEPISTEIYDC